MKWKTRILRSIPQVRFNHVWNILFVTNAFLCTQTAEAAPYMLDKNTPRRKSVLIFCTSFFFSIRRVAFFFFLFLFLFNLAVCKLRRITYIACVRCQFCIFYSNRNRFIRTGKKECFGIFDNIEILLPIFIVYIYIFIVKIFISITILYVYLILLNQNCFILWKVITKILIKIQNWRKCYYNYSRFTITYLQFQF